jgi:hypothetical protein
VETAEDDDLEEDLFLEELLDEDDEVFLPDVDLLCAIYRIRYSRPSP